MILSIKRNGIRQPMAGAGDLVEVIAKPIAKALRLPCLDAQHQLRPSSPCAKRREALNRLLPFPAPPVQPSGTSTAKPLQD